MKTPPTSEGSNIIISTRHNEQPLITNQTLRNTFFRFKQFTIHQDQAAMKVCTDACVLGAWANVTKAKRILDIGTGTGLLALMLAQRLPGAHIDAVEIDTASATQARQNVSESPFAEAITVIESSIQDFTTDYPYDLIISNPPFFQNSLRSPDNKRNRAAHDEQLSLGELAAVAQKLLAPRGTFTVLLPPYESGLLENECQKVNLFLTCQLTLRHSPKKTPFRLIRSYQKTSSNQSIEKEVLCIQDENGQYTPDFVTLLQAYYLIF
ncbi:MAG: methyltransferase [Siphonobacter sp.]